MTAFDFTALAVVGCSIIISVWRGAVREVLALLSWVAAVLVGQAYAVPAGAYLPAAVSEPAWRVLGGFVGVFLLVLVSASLLSAGMSHMVRAVGLGPIDRGLGAIFGLLRGMLVILVVVLACGFTTVPRHPSWRNAMLSPPLEALAASVKPWLPAEMARRISYE